MFTDINADIILFGHDHKPSVNRDEHRLFAKFGSLGCPAKDGNVARAGIITINNGKFDYEIIQVSYDVDKVIADINRLGYPAYEEIKMFFLIQSKFNIVHTLTEAYFQYTYYSKWKLVLPAIIDKKSKM